MLPLGNTQRRLESLVSLSGFGKLHGKVCALFLGGLKGFGVRHCARRALKTFKALTDFLILLKERVSRLGGPIHPNLDL